MKKYLLFDNDGVLVETEMWYYQASKKALGEWGLSLEFDRYMEIMVRGGTAWEIAQEHGYTQEQIDQKREQRDHYYQEYLQTQEIEIKGVVEVLRELKENYKMGIVTTSRRVDFDLIHRHRDIVKYMDFTLCVEEYPRAKPHPDPYLAGMAKFGASPEECLVIEDSKRGLSAAVNAGIECAVVHNEFTKTHDLSAAHYRLQTLKELPLLLDSI